MAFQFIVVLYLQEFRDWSPIQTALAMLVFAIDVILAPTLTPRLVERFGLRRVIIAGAVFAVLAYLLFLPVGEDWGYTSMLPSFLALGLAFTLAYGPLTIAATDQVPEADQGLSSGLLYTAAQFGAAIGLVSASAVQTLTEPFTAELVSYRAALLIPLAASVLGLLLALIGREAERGSAVRPT